jgi:2-polyprenyl-3-methyl-5-hydroxy-6-metoxy-1,4-benzoquinol methylase
MEKCLICGSNPALDKTLKLKRYDINICQNCDFRWLDPQPTDEELSRIYSDQYFLDEGNSEITELVNQIKRATAKLYLDQLIDKSFLRKKNRELKQYSILEIGCGMGDFLLESQALGFNVSGLEVTDYLVAFANRRLGGNYVQKGYIETSSFEKGTFDIVAFFDVVEHVRSPLDFMTRIHRLLKPSGIVYIVTPSLDSWSAKLLGENWMEYKVEHLSYFSKKSLSLLLEKTGFQNITFHANYKILNFDYINRHFIRFPVRGISPLLNLGRKLTPDKLAYMPVKIVASGMAVLAEKR